MWSVTGIRGLCLQVCVIAAAIMFCASPSLSRGTTGADSKEYVVGAEDVLNITVWDNEDLTGNVKVGLDGYLEYKFIGRIKASGLTTSQVAGVVSERLAQGYINDPQVTVHVATYRSKAIFIIGEVNRPGTYYLTKQTTIVEAISMAQGPTRDADPEVIIVRKGEKGEGNNIIVNLRRALEGDLSRNIVVQEGDSIFISKAKTFFIMGEVHKPGQYKLEKDTSVRRAISIAGGHTEKAALNRVKIIRIDDKGEQERQVKLDELVQPLDTLVVPQSYF
ncbi:MAG TPA: periplasmic polysaccharide biosynthesis/export protein [Nitrospirae bacterium]|nr:periplasmic polysaccharide biosynthesis/export protein [Nitrospirota bacterium]